MSIYLITVYRLGLKIFRWSIRKLTKSGIHNSILQTFPRNTQFFRKEKTDANNIFEMSLAGIAQQDEGGGRILPAIKQADGPSFCSR
jgi:hypothetical protein